MEGIISINRIIPKSIMNQPVHGATVNNNIQNTHYLLDSISRKVDRFLPEDEYLDAVDDIEEIRLIVGGEV